MKVLINYTNWKGVNGDRVIEPPFRLFWGSTEFHPERQWLLEAVDTDKNEFRTFALKDISSWRPEKGNG
jgi:predicted DNA-binding transcriptional regulator YafY